MEETTIITPEEQMAPKAPNNLVFKGSGVELLGITLYNTIITSFTLGLYYPWARVARLKFLYQNSYLNDTPFVFNGTGKELFKGFIKFFAYIIIFYGGFIAAFIHNDPIIIAIVYFVFLGSLFFIIPLAIHGALRYRLSRTSWRGIHFGYRGNRGKLIGDYIIGSLLTTVTLGIYQSWFTNNLRTYIIGNIRFGSIYFGYEGDGGELFWINFKGLVLSILTLGIYYFWYQAEYMNYFVKNTYLEHDGKRHELNANFEGSEYFGLLIVNLFLTLFTFGFGAPFATVRLAKFIINNISIPQELDFEKIAQTEDEYLDATGEDVIDYLDIGIA
ncbi:MAG: DUF898 family protein [Bacteroidetes bacterium]|nr:MAG: DUF898 family protein [Bacteroidota bacterium]